MTQTIADALREEGLKEGELRSTRKVLRQALTIRFGAVPEELDRRIEAITDQEQLAAAIHKVYQGAAVEELQL